MIALCLPQEPNYFSDGSSQYVLSEYANEDYVCPCCKGKGEIKTDTGYTFNCPECFGRKYKTRYGIINNYIKQSTVGKVRVEAIEDSIEISYMLKETGIGISIIWYEDTLFATKEEANKSIDDKK